MLSVVIDPASLADPEWMERELDTIVDYVTSSPPANPAEPVLVAGDPERDDGWRNAWRKAFRSTR